MIEKQSSVSSQLNLSQPATQPIVSTVPIETTNGGAAVREYSSTQIIVPTSSQHLTVQAKAAAENSAAEEPSYQSGTGRGKGKDFSDSEADASRQILNESTNPNNQVMQQHSQTSRAAV